MQRILSSIALAFLLFVYPHFQVFADSDVASSLNFQLPSLERPSISRYELERRLRNWQHWWKLGQVSLAKRNLKVLRQLQLNLGIRNFLTLSIFLLRRGDIFLKQERMKDAHFCYEQAALFSPSMSEPWFRLGLWKIKTNPTQVLSIVKLYWNGVTRLYHELFGFTLWMIRLALFFAVVIFLMLIFFWSTLLLKHLGAFLHDFQELFPSGVSRFQVELLSFVLLFLPLMMGGGILETLFFWLLVSWFYLSMKERVITTLGLLALSGMVYFSGFVDGMVKMPHSPAHLLYLFNETDLQYRLEKKVRRYLKKHPRDFDFLFAMGLHQKRRGRFKEARRYYKRALEVRRSSAVRLNLANLDFIERNADQVYKEYQRILQRSSLAEAYYNFSVLLQHSRSTLVVQQQVDALDTARALNRKRVLVFQKNVKKQSNRYLMDALLPESIYWDRVVFWDDSGALLGMIWPKISSWIPVKDAVWFGIGTLLFLWLLLPLGRFHFHGKPCSKCGAIVNKRNAPEGEETDLCSQCFHLFVKKEGVAARRRIEKEFAIARYHRNRRRFLIFLSFFFFGSGQVLTEKTLKGLFYMFLLSFYVGLWIFRTPQFVDPYGLERASSWFWIIAMSVPLLLLHSKALREIITHS